MTIASIIKFDKFEDCNGQLYVYETARHVPFNIKRVFIVSAEVGDVRGDHAHKQCAQLLVCLSGAIEVSCDDGDSVTQYRLDRLNEGLLIPPGLWASQRYVEPDAKLMVLCDRVYEADDYMRDYTNFKIFVENKRKCDAR